MKNLKKLLALLLGAALLCGAFAVLAEEVEIELMDIDVETFSPEGLLLEEPEGPTEDGNPDEDLLEPLDIDGALMLDEISVPEDINTEGLLADALSSNDSDPSDFTISDGVLTMYNGTDAEVVIPNGVTEIGEGAFKDNKYIRSVTIPSGVTVIGEEAFDSSSIESVIIPNTVTEIGKKAFCDTDNLHSVDIPFGVTKIGESAFSVSGLESVTLPDSLVEIGEYGFHCTLMTSVTIPVSVNVIGKSALDSCRKLKSVTILGKMVC